MGSLPQRQRCGGAGHREKALPLQQPPTDRSPIHGPARPGNGGSSPPADGQARHDPRRAEGAHPPHPAQGEQQRLARRRQAHPGRTAHRRVRTPNRLFQPATAGGDGCARSGDRRPGRSLRRRQPLCPAGAGEKLRLVGHLLRRRQRRSVGGQAVRAGRQPPHEEIEALLVQGKMPPDGYLQAPADRQTHRRRPPG